MPQHRFEKGQENAYGNYLKELKKKGDGSYERHLEQRAARKAKKQAQKKIREELEDLYRANLNDWLSMLHNATLVQAMKAIQEGDTQAYNAVMDRMIGKPDSNVNISTDDNTPLPWNDDFDNPGSDQDEG